MSLEEEEMFRRMTPDEQARIEHTESLVARAREAEARVAELEAALRDMLVCHDGYHRESCDDRDCGYRDSEYEHPANRDEERDCDCGDVGRRLAAKAGLEATKKHTDKALAEAHQKGIAVGRAESVKVAEARVAELEAAGHALVCWDDEHGLTAPWNIDGRGALAAFRRVLDALTEDSVGETENTSEAAAEDTRRDYVPRGQGEAAGWIRIGRYDDARRRALWVRFVGLDDSYPVKCKAIELCAGREGDDSYVRIGRRGQVAFFDALFETLLRAADHIPSRWAAAQSKGDQCSDKTVSRDTALRWAQSGEPLPEDGVLAASQPESSETAPKEPVYIRDPKGTGMLARIPPLECPGACSETPLHQPTIDACIAACEEQARIEGEHCPEFYRAEVGAVLRARNRIKALVTGSPETAVPEDEKP